MLAVWLPLVMHQLQIAWGCTQDGDTARNRQGPLINLSGNCTNLSRVFGPSECSALHL